MQADSTHKSYSRWYGRLLRLYPAAYHDQFAESMEQTFEDLLKEHSANGQNQFTFVLWIFSETATAIFRENLTYITMQETTKRLLTWGSIIALLLMIPLIAMQFTSEVQWTLLDFVVMGGLLAAVGVGYEFITRKETGMVYKTALGIALFTGFMLIWMTLGVGLIGNEENPANFMYFGVIAIGFIGALIARFQPKGMAKTLLTTAIAQLIVPVMAPIIWRSQISLQDVEIGVWIMNVVFVGLFVLSAFLFNRASLATQS